MTYCKKPILALVTPCFNEEEVIGQSASILRNTMDKLIQSNAIHNDSFVCFIDDGSTDHTWEIICELINNSTIFKGIKLSRNCGHQNALMSGLMEVKDKCDCCITLDVDLQDDVNAIGEMVNEFKKGNDIVLGVRKERSSDSFFKRTVAESFYKLMKLLGTQVIFNHADFRLMSKRALEALGYFKETNLFLRGIIHLIGLQSSIVYYDRLERLAGSPKYTIWKLMGLAFDGITSFSVIPLRMIMFTGFIFMGLSVCMSIYIFIAYLRGIAIPGWPSTMIPVWFIGGLQIMSIGLLGEYIGKIYKEVKARPKYIIETKAGLWEK
jgi:glycosyltransferase involved in cell wall biosynthesis